MTKTISLKTVKDAIRRNWDETVILATFTKVAFTPDPVLDHQDQIVLEAFRRSTDSLENASADDIGQYLSGLSDEQIDGVVNNVKGITHELIFAEMENSDGDDITADLFPDTNHPGTDVILTDHDTGETAELQLKATEDVSDVQDWMDQHPDGRILVTDELADKMGLESTGVENGSLTADVHEVVGKLVDDDTMWDHLPIMSFLTLAPVIYQLVQRYRRGELTKDRLVEMIARATGLKMAKVIIITALLTVPGLNVVVAAVLVAKMILGGQRVVAWVDSKRILPA